MRLEEQLENPAFRALFEQTGEAVVLARADSFRILEANSTALGLLGYPLEALRERTLLDISPAQNHQIIEDFIREASGREESSMLMTRLESQNGEPLPCELSLRFLLLGETHLLLLTFQDISERIRAMEDIELRNIAIANVTSGVTIADARQPDLPLIYVNEGFLNITGYTAREAVGRSCRFLQGDDRDQPALDELREALREGKPCVVQLRNYRKDGTLFHNELHISPVRNEEGELTHFVGIQLDVTEQVRARESLERSEARIRQALGREKELNEIKTRFISMVSHEFRTPMTGIRSSAALLRRFGEKLGADKRNLHLANIERSLKRMNRLLDDVLFFSRVEAHKVKVTRQPVKLNAYFSSLIENLDHIFPDRKILFESQLDDEESFPLDEHLLDHILQNLVGNALKYSSVSDHPVRCQIEKAADSLEFTVIDSGIGIPADDQKKLFEAFHRAGNVGTRQGTGLGLNIALRAVELLGGKLRFESEQNKGSTFTVSIPLETPTNKENE